MVRTLRGTRAAASSGTIAPFTFPSFKRLFTADSPWNARPVNPVLGTYVIPNDIYGPVINSGAYTSNVFLATASDPPVTIYPFAADTLGIFDQDAGEYKASITLPHWPATVVPASGTDGHADVYDETTGIIHAFSQLKFETGQWRNHLYLWSPVNGRGWGEPGHYYQGGRATAVPSSGGVIRNFEFDDGDTMFRHALCMSLTFSALSASPTYVFPATNADFGAEFANFGQIPEGSLMMLPSTYAATGAELDNAFLVKVIATLKTYGAYVVDRNVGTPFAILCENGGPAGWAFGGPPYSAIPRSFGTYADTTRIQAALRRVVSVDSWLDGNGVSMPVLTKKLNMMSMRGPYTLQSGASLGVYETWKQAVTWTSGQINITQAATNGALRSTLDNPPIAGDLYKITCYATGGASMRVSFIGSPFIERYSSGILTDGMSVTFNWPTDPNNGNVAVPYVIAVAFSGNSGTAKSVGATLTAINAL